jgi:hypothetical protein
MKQEKFSKRLSGAPEVAGKDAEIAAQIQTIREYQESGIALGTECCQLRAELATLKARSGGGEQSFWVIEQTLAEGRYGYWRGEGDSYTEDIHACIHFSREQDARVFWEQSERLCWRVVEHGYLDASLLTSDAALSTSPQAPVQVVPEELVLEARYIKATESDRERWEMPQLTAVHPLSSTGQPAADRNRAEVVSTETNTRYKMQAVFPGRESSPFSIKSKEEFERLIKDDGWLGVKAQLLKVTTITVTEVIEEKVGGECSE